MKTKLIFFLLLLSCYSASTQMATAQTVPAVENKAAAVPALSDAQRQAIKRIDTQTKLKAAPVALRLASVVSRVYKNMLADQPDERLRVRLSAEMKRTTWELLAIKGQSIRETVQVLTPAQKQFIKSEMRKPGAPADLSELIARTFNLEEK